MPWRGVEKLGLIAQNDRGGIDRFKNNLQEKQDELKGANGYERVADAQLNAFLRLRGAGYGAGG